MMSDDTPEPTAEGPTPDPVVVPQEPAEDAAADTPAEPEAPSSTDEAAEVAPVPAPADTAEDTEDDPAVAPVDVPAGEPAPEPSKKRWYVVKVASGREESIKAAIERMIKIEGLEPFFSQIVIPVERVTEVKKVKETKNGEKITKEKRVVKEKKKFPGYLMAEVEWNADIQTLFRDTSGVGDFVGSTGPGKEPAPMSDRDVQSMLYGMLPDDHPQKGSVKAKGPDKIKLDFEQGDKVRIREGAFATFEGDVKQITMPKEAGETPKVTVVVKVFGRDVDVALEYWQVDKV